MFTRWCNFRLLPRGVRINEGTLLNGSLDDGTVLWNLLEGRLPVLSYYKILVVSGKSLPRCNMARYRIQKISNISTLLGFLAAEKVRLQGVSAEGKQPIFD